jgi:hypothetical protein
MVFNDKAVVRKFLGRAGGYPLLKAVLGISLFVGWTVFIMHYGPKTPHQDVLIPLLLDPLCWLSVLTLSGSYVLLDFMQFRMEQDPLYVPQRLNQFSRQRIIPKRYEALYGKDIYVKTWRLRFLFMVFFIIAGIRWFLHGG